MLRRVLPDETAEYDHPAGFRDSAKVGGDTVNHTCADVHQHDIGDIASNRIGRAREQWIINMPPRGVDRVRMNVAGIHAPGV